MVVGLFPSAQSHDKVIGNTLVHYYSLVCGSEQNFSSHLFRSSVIFRIWGDTDDSTESINIWKTGDGTKLSYSHYSNDTGNLETTVETESGALILNKWNFIAVSYDYGEGKQGIEYCRKMSSCLKTAKIIFRMFTQLTV